MSIFCFSAQLYDELAWVVMDCLLRASLGAAGVLWTAAVATLVLDCLISPFVILLLIGNQLHYYLPVHIRKSLPPDPPAHLICNCTTHIPSAINTRTARAYTKAAASNSRILIFTHRKI